MLLTAFFDLKSLIETAPGVNISRKATVNYILNGEQPSLDGLRELCLNETLTAKPKERARIGF